MRYYSNILKLIGRTPLVRINKSNPNPNVLMLAKLEKYNPSGSVKDRIAISMIEEIPDEFIEDNISPKDASIHLAKKHWKTSKGALLIEYSQMGYELGIIATPMASYLSIPVFVTDEMDELAEKYMQEKIVTDKYYDDALHIAIATVMKIDVLVSWNFKHIVNYDKIIKFNGVNISEGYSHLEIRTPREVIDNA